jgi:hypothetical protein
MRGIAVPYVLVAAVLLGNAAVAQNNPDQTPPQSSGSAQTTGEGDDNWGRSSTGIEAPIGHRQPRAKDVPARIEDNLGVRSPEDDAIDRKLRICRDC